MLVMISILQDGFPQASFNAETEVRRAQIEPSRAACNQTCLTGGPEVHFLFRGVVWKQQSQVDGEAGGCSHQRTAKQG